VGAAGEGTRRAWRRVIWSRATAERALREFGFAGSSGALENQFNIIFWGRGDIPGADGDALLGCSSARLSETLKALEGPLATEETSAISERRSKPAVGHMLRWYMAAMDEDLAMLVGRLFEVRACLGGDGRDGHRR
jgi:hypothetical protein